MANEPIIDKAWFAEQMKRCGYATQADFAKSISLSAPKLTNSLAGKRRFQADEVQLIALMLKQPLQTVLDHIGLPVKPGTDWVITDYDGYVDDDASVKIIDINIDYVDLGGFFNPMGHVSGSLIQVRSGSLSPRYRLGDVLWVWTPSDNAFRHSAEDYASLIGSEVVCCLEDHACILGVIHPGSFANTWTVIPAAPRAPPRVNVALKWVSAVDALIPKWTAEYPLRNP